MNGFKAYMIISKQKGKLKYKEQLHTLLWIVSIFAVPFSLAKIISKIQEIHGTVYNLFCTVLVFWIAWFIIAIVAIITGQRKFYKRHGKHGNITFDIGQNLLTFVSNKNEIVTINLDSFMFSGKNGYKQWDSFKHILILTNYNVQAYINNRLVETGISVAVFDDLAYSLLKNKYYIREIEYDKNDNNNNDD